MKATHAPYAIIGDLVITYGATTKTACGKRRKTGDLVLRGTQTCEKCSEAIERDRHDAATMRQSAIDCGLM